MKKIYSIVLMAAALLVGTNVNAEVKDASDLATLKTAWAEAGDNDTILLKNNIELDATLAVTGGRSIKLNLGGKTLSFNADKAVNYTYEAPLTLVHGTLQVYNGTIQWLTNKAKDNIAAIEVFGAGFTGSNYDIPMLPSTDAKYANWSTLIIGNEDGDPTNLKAGYSSFDARAYGAGVEVYGFGDNGVKTSSTGATKFLHDLDYKTSSSNAPGGNGKFAAYGVNITVKAGAVVEGGKYGLQIGGNVKQDADVPTINIEKGAEIKTNEELANSAAVYGAGVGTWNISGEVHGATGLYVKSGTINVQPGAQIYSDKDDYRDPTGHSSGVEAGGSAIVYESNVSYFGNFSINVLGGTIGSAQGGGYAIEGYNSKPSSGGSVELKDLNIQGGTIVAGGEGALETEALKEAIQQGATFVVNGATVTTDATDLQDLNTLITLAGNSTIIAQQSDGTYVIENKPSEAEVKPDGSVNVNNAKAYVEWNTVGKEETVDGDREIGYLSMSKNSKLTIPAGMSLKAGQIVMHSTAKIDVQAGGKLIITDKNGLVAEETSNIKIEYKNGVAGLFYLSPDAKANKNPSATVELTSKKAYKDGSKYIYERLGMPAYNGMKVNDVVTTVPAAQVAVVYWNDGWKVLNKAQNVAPFVGLGLTTQVTDPGDGIVFNFPCNLMGNANADLNVAAKWSYFANSYMANVDLKTFAEAIEANVPGVAQGVYLDPQGKEKWNPVSLLDLKQGMGETKLNPMQGFILNRTATDDAVVTINYNDMVWPTRLPASSGKAARNRVMDENLTRVKITITNEDGIYDYVTLRQSDEYTAEIDNSGDMEKYMSAVGANLYAVSNELGNMAQIATDNMDGMILGVAANKNEVCKMTFSYVCGEQMAIRDNLTGATITMVEGAEYFFTATEGDNANRFEIVAVKNAPTDVETVVETTGAKAVYTVLGQYMGTTEDWNTLPNGIYVVDGVKMVK